MLLRLAPTSLVSFSRYADYLERKGVGDMSWVGTKLTFDHDVSYPKIEFTAISYVTEDQDAQIAEVMKSPSIERILYGFNPTDAPTEAAEPDILGTPPARTNNVRSLPARAAPPEPPPEEEEEVPPEEEEEAPPPPPPATQRATLFQASTTKRAPGRVSTQTTPALAPSDLEGAIDDLLDQPS
jgi:hypothetical protein